MDKFAQISLDFFNQPSPSNGEKDPVNTGPANQAPNSVTDHVNAEPANLAPYSDTDPVNAEPLNQAPKVEIEEHHLPTPTVLQEPEIIPDPSFIGAPLNDLVSMITDDDHPDIIDFTILGEKEASYEQQELVSKSTRGRKSLKSFDRLNGHPEIPSDEILNQKQYYSIGEVAVMFRVNPSLLRFWEAEFDIIQPRKNKKGDRHFRPIDIRNLELIYDLLRRRKLTIEGAREYLKQNSRAKERYDTIQSLQKIRSFLLELKANL